MLVLPFSATITSKVFAETQLFRQVLGKFMSGTSISYLRYINKTAAGSF